MAFQSFAGNRNLSQDSVFSSLSPYSSALSVVTPVDNEVVDFLREADESVDSHLFQHPQTAPTPSGSRLSLALTRIPSRLSVNTVISAGQLLMSLAEFCKTIDDRRSLRKAEIRTVDQYATWTGNVVHRFLILELHREGRKSIWVRLDRHRDGTIGDLLRGTARARDEAILKADKESLINGSKAENQESFNTPPTLGELRLLLEIISAEMAVYTIWPENCYFLCSLIQEHLGATNEGTFIYGKLSHQTLAKSVRRRVYERVRLMYHMPMEFTFLGLFQGLDPDQAWPSAQELSDTSAALDRSETSDLEPRARNVHRICALVLDALSFVRTAHGPSATLGVLKALYRHLNRLQDWDHLNSSRTSPTLRQNYHLFLGAYQTSLREHALDDEASRIHWEGRSVMRDILSHNAPSPAKHEKFVHFLRRYGISLRDGGLLDEACEVAKEDVQLASGLNANDPRRRQSHLSVSLHHYGLSLLLAERVKESCAAFAADVDLRRALFETNGSKERLSLASSLHYYSLALSWDGHLSKACDIGAESVELIRALYTIQPDQYRPTLFAGLQHYNVCLRESARLDEACIHGSEEVELARALYSLDPVKHQHPFSFSLRQYALSLHRAGRLDHARAASAEGLRLSGELYAHNPEEYRIDHLEALEEHSSLLSAAGRAEEAAAIDGEAAMIRDQSSFATISLTANDTYSPFSSAPYEHVDLPNFFTITPGHRDRLRSKSTAVIRGGSNKPAFRFLRIFRGFNVARFFEGRSTRDLRQYPQTLGEKARRLRFVKMVDPSQMWNNGDEDDEETEMNEGEIVEPLVDDASLLGRLSLSDSSDRLDVYPHSHESSFSSDDWEAEASFPSQSTSAPDPLLARASAPRQQQQFPTLHNGVTPHSLNAAQILMATGQLQKTVQNQALQRAVAQQARLRRAAGTPMTDAGGGSGGGTPTHRSRQTPTVPVLTTRYRLPGYTPS